MIWFKLAIRELLNSKRFAFFFCLNFSLGLLGFVVLDAYKNSLHNELTQGSRSLLSSDFTVQSSNRNFTAAEKEIIERHTVGLPRAEDTRLFSMAASKNQSRLVRLIGISEEFPLVGTFELAKGRIVEGSDKTEIETAPKAWVNPEVLVQLGVNVGDTIRLGKMDFEISDVIIKDSSGSGVGFNFAPKVYLGLQYLRETNLLLPNSRFSTHLYFTGDSPEQWEPRVASLKKDLTSLETEVSTHKEESQDLSRSLTRLNDYLGLIALVALFLAAIGGAYLFRSFIIRKLADIATILSLGGTHGQVRTLALFQLATLGAISAIGALAMATFVLRIVPFLTKGLLPISVTPTLSWKVSALALGVGIGGSVLICLPLLVFLGSIKPNRLFQEARQLEIRWSLGTLLAVVPGGLLYWSLAIWESNSIKVGTLFTVALAAFCLLFGFMARQIFALGAMLTAKSPLHLRLAVRNLSRNHLSTASCFLTISLATMLVTVVPQIRDVIIDETSPGPDDQRPVLFLADIQDDQVKGISEFLGKNDIQLQNVSPLIRARLLKVDGKEYDRFDENSQLTREEQNRQWARRRGQNLTYRAKVSDSEKIIEGRDFNGIYDWNAGKPAEISIEMRYADRLNAKIGSVLSFDVGGVAIEGIIVNIRRVRWTSFQPNFFIQFQPGVFDDAPKTHLASIGQVSSEQKNWIQVELAQAFPNVSIVDLSMILKTVLEILGKMEWIVQTMAVFAIIAGLVVLFSIASIQATTRRWDINLLKILGANFSDIRWLVVLEFGLLGLAAAVVGVCASFLMAWLFAYFTFESQWTLRLPLPAITTVVVTSITIIVALVAAANVLREKPAEILRES